MTDGEAIEMAAESLRLISITLDKINEKMAKFLNQYLIPESSTQWRLIRGHDASEVVVCGFCFQETEKLIQCEHARLCVACAPCDQCDAS